MNMRGWELVLKGLMVAVLGWASVSGMQGQAVKAGAAAAVSPIAPGRSVESLVDRFEGDMMKVAKAMPAEKYDFTPASLHIPGANFDKVRTFSSEVTHVTQANYSIAASLLGTEPTVDLKAIGALTKKDEIVAALSASFAAVHQSIAKITPANQNEAVDDPGVGPNLTKETEAAWVAAHGYDHYGQMVEYLRMNGIVPPA